MGRNKTLCVHVPTPEFGQYYRIKRVNTFFGNISESKYIGKTVTIRISIWISNVPFSTVDLTVKKLGTFTKSAQQ